MWDYENSVFLLCFCLWREVWAGTFEGLFIPVILIFIKSLKVESLRCCFYTCCTRLSSNMPFSLSAVEVFSTCLSSVLWSMYAWAHHSLVDGNRQDILETIFIAVSSGGYNCCKPQEFTKHFLPPQMKDKIQHSWHHRRWLCFRNHPISYTSLYFSYHDFVFDGF